MESLPIMSLIPSSFFSSVSPAAPPVDSKPISSNILVIAKDNATASDATSGLNAYGVPFTALLVPQDGIQLPELSGSEGGNFGGIFITSEVSYDYGQEHGFQSALTPDQWNQLYAYQLEYGVRLVHQDVYPGDKFGVTPVGQGCCANDVEQLVSISDTSEFPTAGLKIGEGVTTKGLYHYPATITNATNTKEIAQFAENDVITTKTTAAVINNFDGRQQMAFFISSNTTWSQTSTYLQHAWINWITRGTHAGQRRVTLNTQIDDMFLESDIYNSPGTVYRITPADMEGIVEWLPSIKAKMNPGSDYFIEVGHNGNGNIEASSMTVEGESICNGGGIEYDSPPDTDMEFKKPQGTGTDLWPVRTTAYIWSSTCTNLDELLLWWTDEANRDKFAHVSHTFTHLELNNATYADASKEIFYNQVWLQKVGISSAKKYTSQGIIPPAITGLHNGDALKAWWENGVRNCVGDNTRSVLVNKENSMWPYFTTAEHDGFAGMQVNPRWATRIYYNCNSPKCTVDEWIETSHGTGDYGNGEFDDLLAAEKDDTMVRLLGLSHSPYMFHQANLHNVNVEPIKINGNTGKYSIFQAWVETQVQEFTRLVDWPMVSTTHQEVCIHIQTNSIITSLTKSL